jgi:hypothetical protein
MITNSLPVIGCWLAGNVILKVMLEAAAATGSARVRRRQAIESLGQRRAEFMVSPEN